MIRACHIYSQYGEIKKEIQRIAMNGTLASWSFFDVDSSKCVFDSRFVEYINERFHVLLLSGDILKQNSIFTERMLNRLEVPIIVYGATIRDDSLINIKLIRAIFEKTYMFSVATQQDQEFLQYNGISVDFVPSPLLFTSFQSYEHECLENDAFKIGLDMKDIELSTNNGLLKALASFVKEREAMVYLMTEPDGSRFNCIDVFSYAFGERGCVLCGKDYLNLFKYKTSASLLWPSVYSKMDMVISSSSAGCFLSTAGLTPFMTTSEDAKVAGQSVDIRTHLDLTMNGSDIFNKISAVVEDLDSHKRNIEITMSQFEYITSSYIDKVYDFKPMEE